MRLREAERDERKRINEIFLHNYNCTYCLFSVAGLDLHHFGKADPDPHQRGKQDPEPDPHQSEKVEALVG
jgi:hypothetical protein